MAQLGPRVTPCSRSVCDPCTLSDAFDASKSTHLNVTVLGGAVVNNLLADVGDRVYPCIRENPLEEEMATHSSILAWKVPWTEEPDELVYGVAKVKHDND